jgi:hypothetical protein
MFRGCSGGRGYYRTPGHLDPSLENIIKDPEHDSPALSDAQVSD